MLTKIILFVETENPLTGAITADENIASLTETETVLGYTTRNSFCVHVGLHVCVAENDACLIELEVGLMKGVSSFIKLKTH